ncbi:hypothetical protein TWF506_004009 [Arthrobotrys conoides]|uniref:Uncharacterized protein n=1 Tax=Arthrobotrys conoides TaxID=74498 RepID=A0AAN8N1B2_9PEZI
MTNTAEQGKMPAPVAATSSKGPRQGMVGITIPAISNKVFWYDGVRTVKDLCGAVLRQNPILDGKRLTILIDGRRAGFYDRIPEGAVVSAYYRFGVGRYPPNKNQSTAQRPAVKKAAEEVHLGDLLSFDEVPEKDLLSFDEVPEMDLLSFDEIPRLQTANDASETPTMEPKVPRCHILDLCDDEMGLLSHWEALPLINRRSTPKSTPRANQVTPVHGLQLLLIRIFYLC